MPRHPREVGQAQAEPVPVDADGVDGERQVQDVVEELRAAQENRSLPGKHGSQVYLEDAAVPHV